MALRKGANSLCLWCVLFLYIFFIYIYGFRRGEAARVYNGRGSTRWVFRAWKHPSIVIICLRMSACTCGHGFICVSVLVLCLKHVCQHKATSGFPVNQIKSALARAADHEAFFLFFTPSCWHIEAVTRVNRGGKESRAQVEWIYYSPPFKT